MDPKKDFIGFNFRPTAVVMDNVSDFLHTKRLIKSGTYSPDAPIARDYASIELGRFVEELRTMIYDPEDNITLETATGGSVEFDQAVANAKWEEYQSGVKQDNFWDDVFTPDSLFER